MTDKKYSAETVEILREITKLTTINKSVTDKINIIYKSNNKQWERIDKNCRKIVALETNQKNLSKVTYIAFSIIGAIITTAIGIMVKFAKFI